MMCVDVLCVCSVFTYVCYLCRSCLYVMCACMICACMICVYVGCVMLCVCACMLCLHVIYVCMSVVYVRGVCALGMHTCKYALISCGKLCMYDVLCMSVVFVSYVCVYVAYAMSG